MVARAKTKTRAKTNATATTGRIKTAKSPTVGMTTNTARAGIGGGKAPKPVTRPASGTKTGGGKPAGSKRSG